MARVSAIPYCIAYCVPVFVLLGAKLGGYWNLLTPAFVFGFIPTLDVLVGLDHYNPTHEESKELNTRMSFRVVTWIWVPAQLALIVFGVVWITSQVLTSFEYYAFAVSVGICTGALGINIAHELIHKNNVLERNLGRVLLVSVFYGHFDIEHIDGHHRRVATMVDPATSRLHETLYSFLPRSIFYSFTDSWHLEAARMKKEGRSVFSIFNRMLIFNSISMGIAYCMWRYGGSAGLHYFLLQSVIAFMLLEVVNYIEHYGLQRKQNDKGAYTAVTPMHSWNAGHRVTNYFLFKLQRHSDHHAYASRRYQVLRSFKAAPQMPTGYAGMMLVSLLPPVWFRMMNPRVDAVYKKIAEYETLNVDPFKNPDADPLERKTE